MTINLLMKKVNSLKSRRSTKNFSVLLNENFVFARPVIVTVAHWLPERKKVFFFQSVLERIEDRNYVLANNAFVKGSEEIHIPVNSPYYNWDSRAMRKMIQKQKSSLYEDNNVRLNFFKDAEKKNSHFHRVKKPS